jgi:hypothetical protein
MIAYTQKSKTLGLKLIDQGLTVLTVTDIGRSFFVTLPSDSIVPDSIDLGKRNLKLYEVTDSKDLRTGETVLSLRFAPIL